MKFMTDAVPRILRVMSVMLMMSAAPVVALEDAEIVDSIQKATAIAIGRPLSEAEAQALAEQTARAISIDRGTVVGNLPVIAESAVAMRQTQNLATQGVLYDSLRQLFHVTFYAEAEPIALQLMVPDDTLVQTHQPGMGLAFTDIYASAWLRALYEGRFDHPDKVELSQDDITTHMQELLEKFPRESPENQQVMSRMNAWAAGLRQAWPDMSPEERRSAAAVSTEPDIPSETVVEKVTGTRDVIKWIAGMDLALDETARARFPAMVQYHEAGRTAEAMAGLFGRLGAGDLAATWSEFQSLQMLQNLNNYYSHGGLLSGGDAGGFMLGLE